MATLMLFQIIYTLILAIDSLGNNPVDESVTNTPVLFSESDPRVLIFHGGTWGYICASGWNSRSAQVLCRMNGHWHGEGRASFSVLNGTRKIWLDDIRCNGDEMDISQCAISGWGLTTCSVGSVAEVDCSYTGDSQIRLLDGFSQWEGRVEVKVGDDLWRPICSKLWSNQDASVVCRQLGLRSNGGVAHTDGKYGKSSSNALITESKCIGEETDIANCPATLVNGDITCEDSQAGVECYNCGGEYRSEEGFLTSDNYPNNYPNNENCLYVIRPPSDGRLYKLTFVDFNTEECCDKIQVNVLNESSSNNIADGKGSVYSGSSTPPSVLGTAFSIIFTSDGTKGLKGFSVHWAPSGIQDVINATCDAGFYLIQIDVPLLKRVYPYTKLTSIGLSDPNCTGVQHGDTIVIKAPVSTCNSQVKSNGVKNTYSNYVVDRVFATDSNLIVRGNRWRMQITCSVSSTKSFEVHYNPSSHMRRKRRELDYTIHKKQSFPVTIDSYTDETMTTVINLNKYALGDEMYLRVKLQRGDDDLNLVINDCYTNPSRDIKYKQYYIIKNSCEVDSETHILQRTQQFTDLKINVFQFSGEQPYVYLNCVVSVCTNTETSGQCSNTCTKSRNRRDIKEDFDKSHIVNFGPINVRQ
ncbi:hypothetical protein SNE40_013238 [Patella caerulea]|uniref:Scavenger receptor cysteine-rich domain-containing protein DMBT1 n=1 Tax=Patella caerulea TaxID=87958 RepID=A0AAN8JMS4_PATCE